MAREISWEEVVDSLNNGYENEVACYQRLLESLKKTKEQLTLKNLSNVLLLQEEQRKVIGNIEATEKTIAPYREEWVKRKHEESLTFENRRVSAKIARIDELIRQLLALEESSLAELSNGKLNKKDQIKTHRDRKNGHLAYKKAVKAEAFFWDRKS